MQKKAEQKAKIIIAKATKQDVTVLFGQKWNCVGEGHEQE